MLKPSIPETVALIAENLHVTESSILSLDADDPTTIQLFTWHMLTMLGHSDAAIAHNFKTTPPMIRDGITEWRRIIRNWKAPLVTERILAELKNPTPSKIH